MSNILSREFVSNSVEVTEAIGQAIGRNLRGGEAIELVSDLGGGKTTFTRGLARGVGTKDIVSSPTFTISKVYTGGRLELHHFDFYRLTDAGLAANELHDLIGDSELAVVVEWAEVVAHVLPDQRLTIHLKQASETTRQLVFSYPDSLDYLTEGL